MKLLFFTLFQLWCVCFMVSSIRSLENRSFKCTPFSCFAPCRAGLVYERDVNGCQVNCNCVCPPSTVRCRACPYGSVLQTDENGCQIGCQCVRCNIIYCFAPCPNGQVYKLDANGCQVGCDCVYPNIATS